MKCNTGDMLTCLMSLSNIIKQVSHLFISQEFVQFLIKIIKSIDQQDLKLTSAVLKVLGQIINKYDYSKFIFKQVILYKVI